MATKINAAFVDALKQPEVRNYLQSQGLELASATSPDALAAFIRSEVARWRAVVQSSGAQVD